MGVIADQFGHDLGLFADAEDEIAIIPHNRREFAGHAFHDRTHLPELPGDLQVVEAVVVGGGQLF